MNLSRIEQIFHQCLALPEAERQAFLERECGGDEALAQELRTLLEHSETDATLGNEAIIKRGFSEGSAHDPQGDSAPGPDPTTLVGQRIGRYEVERVIASGGMGTVLAAIQPGPDRRVALKLLRPEMLGPSLVQRFSLEVQVLGKLHHPNIAQVYDGGSETILGVHVPYFAMEFVPNAVPIHEYANGARVRDFESRPGAEPLGIEPTLRLFSQLCEAISHAHRRGVIHRDLKPDNVLVDSQAEAPQLKVIDFGIARLSEEGSGATGLTSAGQILGTLETMSPEQARGDSEAIDVRTDVYALGVILHQMLTGNAPLDIRGKAIPEAIRVILEDSPRPASEHRQGVRPELDAIILKSLSKNSDQRYESVRAFQDDIRAFLEGRSVTAKAPSTLDVMRMTVRRHRVVLIPAVIIFVVAIAAAVVSTRFGFEAKRNAEEARLRTEEAERLAYASALSAAGAAVEDHDMVAAARLLETCPAHLRGWEWHHLSSRRHQDIASFPWTDGDIFAFVVSSSDGRYFSAIKRSESTVSVWTTDTGERVHSFRHEVPPQWLTFDGPRHLITGEMRPDATHFHRWSLEDGSCESWLGPADMGPAATGGLHGVGYLLCRDLHEDDLLIYSLAERRVVARTSGRGLQPLSVDSATRRLAIAVYSGSESTLEIRHPLSMVVERTLDTVETHLTSHPTTGSTSRLRYPVFGPEARYVAAGSDVGMVFVWDLDSSDTAPLYVFDAGSWVEHVVISDDGETLVASTAQYKILQYSLLTGQHLRTIGGFRGKIRGMQFLPGSDRLLTLSVDSPVQVWDMSQTDPGRLATHESFVYPIEVGERSGLVLSGGWDGFEGKPGSIRWSDLESGTAVGVAGTPGAYVLGARLAPNETEVLLSLSSGTTMTSTNPRLLVRQSMLTGEILSTWEAPARVDHLAVDPTYEHVVTGDVQGMCRVIRLADWEVVHEAKVGTRIAYPYYLLAVAWSPTGDHIAVAMGDRIQIRDAKTFDVVTDFRAHEQGMHSLQFDPSGSRVVSASEDQTVKVWSVPEGKELATLVGHGADVLTAKFSPDGTRIASGGRSGEILIWLAGPYEALVTIQAHDSYVYDLEWTADGTSLVSGSGDGTVRVWDTLPARERLAAKEEREQIIARVSPLIEAAFRAGPVSVASLDTAAVAAEAPGSDAAPNPGQFLRYVIDELEADERETQVIWQEVLRRSLERAASDEPESRVAQ